MDNLKGRRGEVLFTNREENTVSEVRDDGRWSVPQGTERARKQGRRPKSTEEQLTALKRKKKSGGRTKAMQKEHYQYIQRQEGNDARVRIISLNKGELSPQK